MSEKWRQYEFRSGEVCTTGWLESDVPLQNGTRLTLKHEPDREWTIVRSFGPVLDVPPDRRWKVGGLG